MHTKLKINKSESKYTNNNHIDLIQEDVTLAEKNWFKTGGRARYYAAPHTVIEFKEAITFGQIQKLDSFVLGSGANILICDDGFEGLVIHPKLSKMNIESNMEITDKNMILVTAQAGVTMEDLINWCLDHNILGLEEFSGIPGTVGGSVFINLHYYQFLISQFLVSAQIIHKETSELKNVTNDWFKFGYDISSLYNQPYYLVQATFKLRSASDLEVAYARGRATEIIRHRKNRYPYKNTCGSFFRNFHENEVTLENNGKKVIWAAYYLDNVGVKGSLRVGMASVSHQHANMIVTQEGATSQDVINLAREMQELVYKKFGVILKSECRLVGFTQCPLLI
ncbi:MAG TPA: UDP-N-acetylmuramate dehydrogenase [Candidatus Babeliales bacterium]|nr:UDP-N-acetylmuramate dehydrogenase [Candidatus Babeliales bacterium]